MSTVFLRRNGVWCLKVKVRSGAWVQRTCETRDRALAKSMGRMIDELGHRGKQMQDLLDVVEDGHLSIPTLYEAFAGNQLDDLRERLRDVDLSPLVQGWLDSLRARLSDDTIAHYGTHVRTLIPSEKRFPSSTLTYERVSQWLAGIKRSPGTRRKYHAAMSSFCQYLKFLGVLRHNLMRDVKAPSPATPRRRHLDHADVLRIVSALDEPYRTIVALMHGSGVEVSVVLSLKRRDIDLERRQIHAQGTKIAARDRIVTVEPWVLPYLKRCVRRLLPNASLFPSINRWTVSDKHREACHSLEIEDYQLRDSRHTFAVRAIRAGASYEAVALQLGHADTSMAIRVYGRFKPTDDELRGWHKVAQAQDRKGATK